MANGSSTGSGGTSTNRDIFVRPVGADTTGRPLVATEANERAISVSPDGAVARLRLGCETGPDEIFVTRFPEGTGKWQVSSGGGTSPQWGHSGSELFYVGFTGRMTAAHYTTTGGAFSVSSLEPLFPTQPFVIGLNATSYEVSEGDGRFLMVSLGEAAGGEVVWVRNWLEAIR